MSRMADTSAKNGKAGGMAGLMPGDYTALPALPLSRFVVFSLSWRLFLRAIST